MAEQANMTGLSDEEARTIHAGFMQVFGLYIAIAVVAHILMWMYKPWFS
jgi:light-harvesting complex 1 beta chain